MERADRSSSESTVLPSVPESLTAFPRSATCRDAPRVSISTMSSEDADETERRPSVILFPDPRTMSSEFR